MHCPLLPLSNLIVVTPILPPTKVGSIILVTRESPTRGRVRACGPDAHEAKIGSVVFFKKHVATTVEIGDAEWWLVRESDVLARIG